MKRLRFRASIRPLALRAAVAPIVAACMLVGSVPALAPAAPGPNDVAAVRAVFTTFFRAWHDKNAAVYCATLSPAGIKHLIYYESYYAGRPLRTCLASARYFFASKGAQYPEAVWKSIFHQIATSRVVFGHDANLTETASMHIQYDAWTLIKVHGGWAEGV